MHLQVSRFPKNEHSSRSAFDGRRLGLLCNAPPPANILDVASILKLVPISTSGMVCVA